eukprot:gene10744-12508_t
MSIDRVKPDQIVNLPQSLTSLSFNCYNEIIPVGAFPSTITYLDLGNYFNQSLLPGMLPSTLLHLRIGLDFDQKLSHPLPATLVHLTLQGYVQPLDKGILPNGLLSLTLGGMLMNRLDPEALPQSLKHLHLANYMYPIHSGFISSPRSILPDSIEHLTLGGYFNNHLPPGSLPPRLRSLDLGSSFNFPLAPGALPLTLQHLGLGHNFDQPLTDNLITSLTSLSLHATTFQRFSTSPPKSLQSITILQQPGQHPIPHDIIDRINKFLDLGITIDTASVSLRKIDHNCLLTIAQGVVIRFATLNSLAPMINQYQTKPYPSFK